MRSAKIAQQRPLLATSNVDPFFHQQGGALVKNKGMPFKLRRKLPSRVRFASTANSDRKKKETGFENKQRNSGGLSGCDV